MILVASLLVVAMTLRESRAQSPFPPVDKLPTDDKLPDPFQFFGSERRVEDKSDWDARRAEMLRMVEHYVSGPAFPQTHNAKLENLQTKEVYNGKATHHTVRLAMGPGHAIQCTFEYLVPNTDGRKSLLFYICPRREYADETIPWRERIIDRGYAFVWVIVGQFNGYKDHGPVKDAFPEIKGNTMMAWVWGINEVIHYLDKAHDIDNVIVAGTSRFGKTASMAGALNERIGLTVPVTGGFGVRRFNAKDQRQPASAFAGRCWSNEVFPTFAGQLNKLPVDQHFVGALIAPRGLLAIMGDENTYKNVGHIEAHEALVPVYEWLDAKDKLGLYDHAPRGHGFGEDDFFTILDFADQIFYGKKPRSGKAFDQISNPDLVGFEWEAPAPISE
jgi:hypothetical protein